MDFALTEEQQAIFDMAREFGQSRIAPFARQWESDGSIPRALWSEVAELGLGGLYVSEEYGGTGLSRLDATLVFEALSMACPSVASFLSIHNMCGGMIDKFGSQDAKERWLPDLCSMTKIFSYCLTEPGSGSDAAALRTSAKAADNGWAVNGTKAFISGGGYSDAYIVMSARATRGPRASAPSSSRMVQTVCPLARWKIKWAGGRNPRRKCNSTIAPCPPTTCWDRKGGGFPMPWQVWTADV